MRALFTVFGKEFLENLRDRRTLVSALLFGPLFGPLLFGLMVSRMLNQSVVESDEPLRLTISGGERAPGLTHYLESRGVKLGGATCRRMRPEPPSAAAGAQVVLIVPKEFAARFSAAEPAPVLLVADSADSQTRKIADRARAFSRQLRQRHRAAALADPRRESAARGAGRGQRRRRRDADAAAPWWCWAS